MTQRTEPLPALCLSLMIGALTTLVCQSNGVAGTFLVGTRTELIEAASSLKPGDEILIKPGDYAGGLTFYGLRGQPQHPLVIRAEDPTQPPRIVGGKGGLHLVNPSWVELRDLVIEGTSANGLNIDDGGSYQATAHHITLSGLSIRRAGPKGNIDGIKLSGVADFRVSGCSVERWGDAGSGIDMVGCHRGLIESNLLRHVEIERASGIQCKGGSSEITIRRNRLIDAGARGVNIGGSTGLRFFRPPLKDGGPRSEARDIRVEGNVFVGCGAPVSFVGVDGAVVRFNTFFKPRRWVFRILQETRAPGFVPSRDGRFTGNLIVFQSDQWASGGVNVGPFTSPETFVFERNWWFCVDNPERSRPRLPQTEIDGSYGKNPLLTIGDEGLATLDPASPARPFGSTALP